MTRSVLVAVAFTLALLPGHGRAQAFASGAQLTRFCTGRTPADTNACEGYLGGVLDAVRDSPEYKDKVCPPSNTKLAVLREGLGKFGQQRPEEARGPGVALVISFIKTAYPCPAK